MDKKHLNKIVDYLLDDTEIHYEYQSLQIIGSDIEYDIDILSNSKGFFDMMWDKLEYDYGLNTNDCLYVYGNYLYQINIKMKDYGSINESVDNKEKYLDKIVQYILDDTKLDYGQKEVIYPFIPNVRSQWGLLVPLYYATIESPLFNEFSEYCNDTYGLTYDESVYVWDQYKVIFNHKINSKPMNESINSRGDYLDKVIEYMVDDTIIDYKYKSVNLLFLDPPMLLFLFLPGIPPEILEYCNYVYGLNDDETNYVWRKYRDIIVDNFDRKKHQ